MVGDFVTLNTEKDGYKRTVTIAHTREGFFLLGNLEHNTQLIIDQKLIDDLQRLIKTGDKKYYVQYGIGRSKYVVNYHDGIKKYGDGSPFYDVAVFRNKKLCLDFIDDLKGKGYKDV